MGKNHLFRILGIGLILSLLALYFMFNPTKSTTAINNNRNVIDSVGILEAKAINYIEPDTLEIIQIHND